MAPFAPLPLLLLRMRRRTVVSWGGRDAPHPVASAGGGCPVVYGRSAVRLCGSSGSAAVRLRRHPVGGAVPLPCRPTVSSGWGVLLAVVETRDPGAERIQTAVDVAVSAVDLLDVLDRAAPLGTHGCDQQGHTRADVG